jgi:Dienelactone hydrolase and related enzymes
MRVVISMRLAYFVLISVGFFSAISCDQLRGGEDVYGVWTAEDSLDGAPYKHVLKLDTQGQRLVVSTIATYLDYPVKMQFDTASFNGDSVHLWSNNPRVKDTFKGKWGGDVIVGEFMRNGQRRKVTFHRFDLKARRPQTPIRPFPYVEEEVRFANRDSSVVFGGTLTYPDAGKRFPAVLLISGAFPHDRDGTAFYHKPYLVIADYLTRHGFAVLRLDDRNVGKTVEVRGAKVDFVDDAFCAFEFLRQHENVDRDHIGVVGHSQGGMIAMEAAAANSDVAAVVTLVSPISIPGTDYFVNHHASLLTGMPHSSKEKVVGLMTEILLTIKDTPSKRIAADLVMEKAKAWVQHNRDDDEALSAFLLTPDDARDEKAIGRMLEQGFGYYFSRDHYYILSYEPDSVIPKVKCPILAVYGGHDNRVNYLKGRCRLESLVGRSGTVLQTKFFENMNHSLQTSTGKDDTEIFELDETVSPELLELLKDWLTKKLNAD